MTVMYVFLPSIYITTICVNKPNGGSTVYVAIPRNVLFGQLMPKGGTRQPAECGHTRIVGDDTWGMSLTGVMYISFISLKPGTILL
jgi:hypothetical protein